MRRARPGPFRVTERTAWRPEVAPWPPTYAVEPPVHERLRAIERADQDLRGRSIGAREAKRLAERALARNAWGTASIEGNPMTLVEVESLLARQATPDAATLPTEREILNMANLLAGLESWRIPRTISEVLDLHAFLFDGVLPDAGDLKEVGNVVADRRTMEVVYVPTPPARVEEELRDALRWLLYAPEHPLVKAMVFFHELQAIHPFRDGNGRVGRALHAIILHQWGYPGVRLATLDASFNEDREGYYGALLEAERGWDRTPWLRYVAGVTSDAFAEAVRSALLAGEVPAGLNDRQATLAEWFARRRGASAVKFADVHAAFPAVPERTLKRDLAALREARVVRMEGERKGASYRLARRP